MFDGAGGDRGGELCVIALVLIGVATGELTDRAGEVGALPDVGADRDGVPGAGVGRASVSPQAVANWPSTGAISSAVGMIFMSRNWRT